MGLVRKSMHPTGQQVQAEASKVNPLQAVAGPRPAVEDGTPAETKERVNMATGLSRNTHNRVENECARPKSSSATFGDGNCVLQMERGYPKRRVLNKEGTLAKNEQRSCPKTPSLLLCEIDDFSEAESGKSPQEIHGDDDKVKHPDEKLPDEPVQSENADGASEFFKSLEISHSKEILAAAEGKLHHCTSDINVADNSFSSFGIDVYVSMSSNECSANETDTLSATDELGGDNYSLIRTPKQQICAERSRGPHSVMGNNAVMYSLSSERLEDEGFSEMGQASETACYRAWGEMKIGPLPEDDAESFSWSGPTPAYWEVLDHRRKMTLPWLASRKQEGQLQASSSDPHLSYSHGQTPILVSESNEGAEDEVAGQIKPPYSKDVTLPLSSTTDSTLGHLYDQCEESTCWKWWVKGDDLFGEFNTSGKHSQKGDTRHCDDLDVSDRVKLFSETGLYIPPPPPVLTSDDAGHLICELPSSKKQLPTFAEPSVNYKLPACGTDAAKAEGGDAARPGGDISVGMQGSFMSPPPGQLDTLLGIPSEDLSLGEKRLVAQALELEWGRSAARAHNEDNGPQNRSATAKRDISMPIANHISPPKAPRHTSLFPLRRGYKSAKYSLSEFSCIVDRGAGLVDRRAMARQAEQMWGQAASSRFHRLTPPSQPRGLVES